MPEIVNGNLVADADDTAVAEFRADLDTGIDWLDSARIAWPGLTSAQKQAWLFNSFDTVLLINVRVLKFIRWLVLRL